MVFIGSYDVLKSLEVKRPRTPGTLESYSLGMLVCLSVPFACFLTCLMLELIGEFPSSYRCMFRGLMSGNDSI